MNVDIHGKVDMNVDKAGNLTDFGRYVAGQRVPDSPDGGANGTNRSRHFKRYVCAEPLAPT